MIRQICRRGRLEALVRDAARRTQNFYLRKLCNVLFPSPDPGSLSSAEEGRVLAHGVELDEGDYDLILGHLNMWHTTWRHRDALPHPPRSKILPHRASSRTSVVLKDRTFTTKSSHRGNSSVQFFTPYETPTQKQSGFIERIWSIPLDGTLRTFMIVRPHVSLEPDDAARSPYINLPDMHTCLVATAIPDILRVIEPAHIICHVTLYRRPKGTFGLSTSAYVASAALDRGRRGVNNRIFTM